MYITNVTTGNSTKPRVQENSNYSIISRYCRNGSQFSPLPLNKKHNPNYLLYEIPEQYNSKNSNNSTNSSKSDSTRYILKSINNNSNEGLFKRNYQISFNQDRHQSKDEYVPTISMISSKRNGSKASMSPGTQVQNSFSRGSTTSSEDNSTLVNSTNSILKTGYSSTKSLLDLVSENENKIQNVVETKDSTTNLHKQLRINQKLTILKQNIDKKSNILDGIQNPETYFYSDVKFMNDKINHQYKNMKLLKSQDFQNIQSEVKIMTKKKLHVSEKYLELVVKNKVLDKDDKKIFIEHSEDYIPTDYLDKLAEEAWLKAEESMDFTNKQ